MTTNHSHCLFCKAEAVPMWGNALLRCTGCGLLFKDPLPTEEELARLYEASWTNHDAHSDEVGGTNRDLARSYAQALAKSLGIADFRGLTILDFGAGTGEMLTALAESGAQVVGVEPFGHEEVRRKGHQVYRSLDELPAGIRFDGIVTMEVVEHLRRPWETLSLLRGLLKDGDWMLVTTPNPRGLNARLTRSRWRELLKPRHLMFFSSRSIEKMLVQCGYPICQRLRWCIEYSPNRLKRLMQKVLQLLRLDGSLRCLAWKR